MQPKKCWANGAPSVRRYEIFQQSIESLKQELANLKIKAAKMGENIKKMEKVNYQLRSELEQLEHYNQYLAK